MALHKTASFNIYDQGTSDPLQMYQVPLYMSTALDAVNMHLTCRLPHVRHDMIMSLYMVSFLDVTSYL